MIVKTEQLKLTKIIKAAKQRDNNHCRRCGATINLEGHHIYPYSYFNQYNPPDLRYSLRNIITLCKECHNLVVPKIKFTGLKNLVIRFKLNTDLYEFNYGEKSIEILTPKEQIQDDLNFYIANNKLLVAMNIRILCTKKYPLDKFPILIKM